MQVLQVGDRVRRKQGGPVMRVRSMDADGALCVWFSLTGALRRARLPIAFLMVIPDDE